MLVSLAGVILEIIKNLLKPTAASNVMFLTEWKCWRRRKSLINWEVVLCVLNRRISELLRSEDSVKPTMICQNCSPWAFLVRERAFCRVFMFTYQIYLVRERWNKFKWLKGEVVVARFVVYHHDDGDGNDCKSVVFFDSWFFNSVGICLTVQALECGSKKSCYWRRKPFRSVVLIWNWGFQEIEVADFSLATFVSFPPKFSKFQAFNDIFISNPNEYFNTSTAVSLSRNVRLMFWQLHNFVTFAEEGQEIYKNELTCCKIW